MNSVHVLEYLLLAVTVSCGSNNVYYVIPTTGNQTCPTGQVCHNISYYAIEFTFPSTGNITLIFLEGQHILNHKLYIFGLNNVTLKGQGYDDHWSTVIYCSDRCDGIHIYTPEVMRMERLTYINGDLVLDASDFVYDFPKEHVYMHSVSLKNVSVNAVTYYVTITDSILDNTNCMEKSCGLFYWYVYRSGNIHNLTIQGVTDNRFHLTGALFIPCYADCYTTLKLTDVTIANNNATGIYIAKCAVEFGNVTISNNHSPFYGGGMWIDGKSNIRSLPNTAVSFINNRAKGVGGAIYIDSLDTVGNSFLHFITIAFV